MRKRKPNDFYKLYELYRIDCNCRGKHIRFLNRISEETGYSKSQLIRAILEEMMSEYKSVNQILSLCKKHIKEV